MKAPWKFALLAMVVSIALASGLTSRTGPAEATPGGIDVYSGACPLPFPLPTPVTSVEPGLSYCVSWTGFESPATGEVMTLAVTGVTGGVLTESSCFSCGAATGSGTATISYDPPAIPFGYFAESGLTFTDCGAGDMTLTMTQGTSLDLDLPCVSQGPAPTVGLTLYPGACADLTVPLPMPVTSVAPGEDYCISTVAGDHVMGDTHTLTSAGVAGESFDLRLCYTNSAGFDPCTDPGAGPSPYVIPLESEDSNSFVGGDTDFSFTACEESSLTLTYSYDGPGLEPASAMESFGCQAEAPFVGLTVYPGTCAGLTVPLPMPVTSVAPGEDYCISTVAGDHVMGDTHTLTSAGVGGETFDLHLCFTNSAGFDPCTDPGAAGSPYVIPLESEDANSFVGGETDFTFTLCEESMLTLTYSYDGPGLAPASISESFDCTDEVLPPGGGFLKYTDEEDEILDPGESFNWYIDVPATSGIWTVKDLLPRGFHLDGPLPAGCWSLFNRYFTCIGFSDNEGVTLVIPVEASDDCGVFTNTAKLIGLNGGFGFDLASDSVSVEGCELQGSSGGGSQQSGSFWDRLWSLIF